ncbi:carboxypeptidase-like regulatory domain-containing protein [Mariniblastus fucicola]|uniref:Carboxypeptidase regulatory-like domain-containing protein n=1 Tax=Mariniblastus fucicola TaxID=980251 RepID=A0A5B9P7N0_9BACT|nr:carboxypeptidase-like regulatory domain-containing protein [Mariniblastus fucicola]QEG22344.1 hypothetical protein MFFC18_22240 [Mariniblastus fucicola]
MKFSNRPIAMGICLIAITMVSGCIGSNEANYSQLGLIKVTGNIKLDGEPLPDTVVFFEQTDGTMSYATTDANGDYRMKFNSEVDGVLPGEVVVKISTLASTGELKTDEGDAEVDPDLPKPKEKKELVPVEYHKESKLNLTIPTGNNVFNFDLNSDGSTTGPI